jgi:hypothetical protein
VEIFRNQIYLEGLRNSLTLATVSTALAPSIVTSTHGPTPTSSGSPPCAR